MRMTLFSRFFNESYIMRGEGVRGCFGTVSIERGLSGGCANLVAGAELGVYSRWAWAIWCVGGYTAVGVQYLAAEAGTEDVWGGCGCHEIGWGDFTCLHTVTSGHATDMQFGFLRMLRG